MQVYFSKVVEAVRAHDSNSKIVLHTLTNHAGLHQLLPYFCHFIPREVCVCVWVGVGVCGGLMCVCVGLCVGRV